MLKLQLRTEERFICEKAIYEHFTNQKVEVFSSNIFMNLTFSDISNVKHLELFTENIFLPTLTRYPETKLYDPRLDNFFEAVG